MRRRVEVQGQKALRLQEEGALQEEFGRALAEGADFSHKE